jgi:hypothetical protein
MTFFKVKDFFFFKGKPAQYVPNTFGVTKLKKIGEGKKSFEKNTATAG